MTAPWIAALVAVWVVLAVLSIVVLGALRRITGVLERAEAALQQSGGLDVGGASVGSFVPPFELIDEGGARVTSAELLREPTLLLFLGASCGPCHSLAPRLGELAGLPLAVVLEGGAGRSSLSIPDGVPVFSDGSGSAASAFDTRVTPHAFVADVGGFVMDRAVPGSIDDLWRLTLRQRGGERPGSPAIRPDTADAME